MYSLIEDEEFLKTYDNFSNKGSKKTLIANPSTKKKTVLKTKIKTHGNEVTHFHDKEMAKVGSTYSCLMVR